MIYGHGDDVHLYGDIRLNFSSNIYAHADITPLTDYLAREIACIRHYPEPMPASLEANIAIKEGIDAECVVVTNGATDAIYLIAEACQELGLLSHGILQPTFAEYADACIKAGLSVTNEEYNSDNILRTDRHNHTVWICSPNNPTGKTISPDHLLSIARKHKAIVIDQSYELLTTCASLSACEAVSSDNIIQIHSMTKCCAIPGLRLGYIVAPSHITRVIRRHIRPWSVNALAIAAGQFIIATGFRAVADLHQYLSEAQRLQQQLNAIDGICAMPTSTNFILCHTSLGTASQLKEWLALNHKILIRDASNFHGLSAGHFRVAAQAPNDNDMLINAIRQWTSLHH